MYINLNEHLNKLSNYSFLSTSQHVPTRYVCEGCHRKTIHSIFYKGWSWRVYIRDKIEDRSSHVWYIHHILKFNKPNTLEMKSVSKFITFYSQRIFFPLTLILFLQIRNFSTSYHQCTSISSTNTHANGQRMMSQSDAWIVIYISQYL